MRRFSAIFVKPGALLLRCLFVAIPVFWSYLACAHELRPAIATIELAEDGGVTLGLSLNLEAAIAGIGGEHEDTSASPAATEYDRLRSLPPVALQAEFDRIKPDFLDQVTIETSEGPVPLRISTVEIPAVGDTALPRFSRLDLKGSAPPGIEHLYWRVAPRFGNSVIRLRDAASEQILGAEFVVAGEMSGPLSVAGLQRQGWISIFVRYLEIGFTHIVPKGLDHILFVIGLFLLSTRLSVLLWQVTAFTVAHTMTLALGMLGIVQISPAVVEPLIAASIIYVAVENIVTDRLHYWRIVVVFCFGLLHGLGFAGVLQEIGPAPSRFMLSLLSFNIGIELGQLAVIVACFLVAGWTMNKKWYRHGIVIPVSLAIGSIAVVWVGEGIGLA